PDHLRARDLRRLPRRVDRHAGAAHAADVGDERDLGDRRRRRDARRGADRHAARQDHGRARGGARRGEHLRRLPRHAAHARNVQEEGQEARARGQVGGQVMSLNLVTLLYLVASICFIQALKGLSHPTTSIRGNLFGMVGMAIAILTTAALIVQLSGGKAIGMGWVLLGLVVGGAYGAYRARTVEMTQMPELVAFFHSMIGLAAVFIAVAAVAEPYAFGIVPKGQPIPEGNRLELFLGAAIGAVTFSGSVIA